LKQKPGTKPGFQGEVRKRHLSMPPLNGHDVVCGMSLGYADEGAAINRLDMPREPIERFSNFLGFSD